MNIFISNLSFNLTVEDLTKIFGEYGEVESLRIIKDKFSGRSKGYGFVEMPEESGKAAIEALNGTEVAGRQINVALARPRE